MARTADFTPETTARFVVARGETLLAACGRRVDAEALLATLARYDLGHKVEETSCSVQDRFGRRLGGYTISGGELEAEGVLELC